ncbi:Protein CBG14251 [Caenorhabditis briggsae]|uniref:Uncharacterized protein n=2 Tax=Caenorhabditis briggsae TaxID=6238 RepID=A0AAE8ZQM8_CAEBR|nr:Protein CBG14251 [Caenorhabditis briggsae]ULT81857.1 hypothetical protein L3Y34_011663 [Caenorhabditis briggsae]CAP32845.1 Protein CBG14251 [Caenorhabditis briggsae]
MLSVISYLPLITTVLFQECLSLSLSNVYTSYINRETIDQSDTFGYHIPKPIGYKGDEPIWPRSYGYSAEMFFDENGAAFPVRPRKKLGSIIRPLHQGVQRYDDDESAEVETPKYDERKALREFYKRFRTRAKTS